MQRSNSAHSGDTKKLKKNKSADKIKNKYRSAKEDSSQAGANLNSSQERIKTSKSNKGLGQFS